MRIERRGRQPHQAFAMVPNDTARDKGLSFRSRGILTLLLSHDDGFNITTDGVAKEGVEGRDAVRTAFKELEAAGYLRRTKARDPETGRITGKVYLYPYGDAPEVDPEVTIEESDSEDDESPETENQSSDFQAQVDQSYKEDHQENQDAAAVTEEGEQGEEPASETPAEEAAAEERDDLQVLPCDDSEPHLAHRWWAEADEQGQQRHYICEGVTVEEIEQASADIADATADQQQQEDQPDVTMEEAITTVTETLGGTVVEDSSHGVTASPGLPVHGPDGPRRQYHGSRTRSTVADDPRVCPPFPGVVQHNLVGRWNVDADEGSRWEATWQAADQATGRAVDGDPVYYDAETHLMNYLMRCVAENRKPRHDLWLRFFLEDRSKHIQVLREQAARMSRQSEDPTEREMRTTATLPPDWSQSEVSHGDQ